MTYFVDFFDKPIVAGSKVLYVPSIERTYLRYALVEEVVEDKRKFKLRTLNDDGSLLQKKVWNRDLAKHEYLDKPERATFVEYRKYKFFVIE